MLISPSEYRSKCNYRIVGYDDALSYYHHLQDSPRLIISTDLETADSGHTPEDAREDLDLEHNDKIEQIQFATNKFDAIIFPRFEAEYARLAKLILELPNIFLGFNWWGFDQARVEHYGIRMNKVKMFDLMQMFKHWQPKLPRGLQAVACFAGFPYPWKHLATSDPNYAGPDVCAPHFIWEWIVPLMKQVGIWDKSCNGESGGYLQYVQKLHPILDRASDWGIPVNEVKRIELKAKLIKMRDELDKILQKSVPDEIKNITPKRTVKVRDTETGAEFPIISYGYKREPKEVTIAYREYDGACKRLSERTGKETSVSVSSFHRFIRSKYGLVLRRLKELDIETEREVEVERWCNLEPFKASKDQLSRYITWKRTKLYTSLLKEERSLAKFYEIPKDHEGKETTRKGEIEVLFEKTGDIVLQQNLEIRSLGTNINNYVKNWQPKSDGSVHTTFGYSAASGQLDARRPNILNCSKHTVIGQLFRRIVEAPTGWSFVEFDKKSFHVATMGYRANDSTYIRFSQLDPHSIFTSYIMPRDWGPEIDFAWSDADILLRCKEIKKRSKQEKEKDPQLGIDIRQQVAKPAVLGNQLGLGPRKMYWQNRRSITSEKYAKELQAEMARRFSKVHQAKKDIIRRVAKQTYDINEFGYIFHCFDALQYRFDKVRNEWREYQGEEAEEVLAFSVQSPAFGMLKDELFRILPRLDNEIGTSSKGGIQDGSYFAFRNTIHDSLVFLFRDEHLDKVVPICLGEMEKPSSKLVNEATGPIGLRVGVEYSIGRNWQSYHCHSDNCIKLGCKLDENLEGMREVG